MEPSRHNDVLSMYVNIFYMLVSTRMLSNSAFFVWLAE